MSTSTESDKAQETILHYLIIVHNREYQEFVYTDKSVRDREAGDLDNVALGARMLTNDNTRDLESVMTPNYDYSTPKHFMLRHLRPPLGTASSNALARMTVYQQPITSADLKQIYYDEVANKTLKDCIADYLFSLGHIEESDYKEKLYKMLLQL